MSFLSIFVLLLTAVNARRYEDTFVIGPGVRPLASASQTPDASASSTIGNGVTYNFRLNVTDVKVNDATDSSGQAIPGAHVVETAFGLTWPGGVPLSSLLSKSAVSKQYSIHSLCATVVDADFPSDIVSRYNADDPGNCDNVFGQSCVAAIGAAVTMPESMDRCPDVFLSSIDACQHVFGSIPTIQTVSGLISSTSNSTNTTSYQSGTPFLLHQSQAYTGDNQAPITAAKQKLQFTMMSFIDGSANFPGTMLTDYVCLVADASSTSTSPGSSSGSTSTSPGVAGPTAVAAAGAMAMAGIAFVAAII